ncbi:MAG: KpsF/GutQ family sugar-phosphate isomerase [Pyrinomonadaceae bacterium]|nr:KpsF/GutQ family sugar-phosphate isomerase [Pyrinomonadaceae bacterium]
MKTVKASAFTKLLLLEADAIKRAARRADAQTVERAINVLLESKGKIVVLGIGKSGVIGQKIAATMTSTGTVAVFVHPSDALHGGLGIITNGDVVIALSNSGETDEILTMLPVIKSRKVPIIAIVGDVNSTLARNAEIVLDASVDKEICPLNLAPTTSTTVALAIGDALAMTLMEIKGLTAEDFASNHPAGKLGKRLTLRVADLMHDSPNIEKTATWLEVVKMISKFSLGAVNVVDANRHLIGIVTDGDLRRAIEKTLPEELSQLTANEMMTSNPIHVAPETLAYDALQTMENRASQISVLPVVNKDKVCTGLIRLHDIVRNGL